MVFLDWVSRSIPDASSASNSDLSAIAVMRVFVALFVRFCVLEPATAWLLLVEASCLDEGHETLVYDYGKGKFARAGVVFIGLVRKDTWRLWESVSFRLCLWLMELHIKKCAVEVVLEGFVFFIARLLF